MATFKPVKEVTDQTTPAHGETFTPVREFTPGPQSAITGQPMQTGEERMAQTQAAYNKYRQWAATGVRYGVPVGAGVLTGGMGFATGTAIGGAASGLSELTARQIERAGTDPEMGSLWKDIKAGGVAAATDVAVSTAMHGVGKGVLAAARRFVLPRAIPREVELAQAVLATKTKNDPAKRWYRWKGNEPFSLSPWQLNSEEKGLVYHLEAVARSGAGAGRFARFDDRNVRHAQEVILDYVEQRATEATGPEFGQFVNRILGQTNKPGELFKPVEAYRSWLYDKYKMAMESIPNAGAFKIDGSALHKMFKSTKDSRVLDMYSDLTDAGILPGLKDANAWKELDVMDVDEAIMQMNSFWQDGKGGEKWNKKLKFIQAQLREPYDQFIRQNPSLKSYRDAANKFYGAEQDNLHREIIKTVRNKLIDNPSTVVDMLNPTIGKPGQTYDNLMHMKKALFFAAEAPETPGKALAGMGKGAAMDMWEKSVLRPLRFHFIAGATDPKTGILNADKVLKRFERIEAKGVPQLLNELWGDAEQVKRIKDLFTAMDYAQTTTTGKSVWIQLKTMAALSSGGAGVWSMFSSDNPSTAGAGIGGAAIILMSPASLAKAMTNPRLTRALYDGFTEQRIFTGIGAKMSLALRKIAQQKAVSEIMGDVKKADGNMWYRFQPVEEEPDNGM